MSRIGAGCAAVIAALLLAGCAGAPPETRGCTGPVEATVAGVQARLNGDMSQDGDTICIANGSYGSFSLNRPGSHSDDVMVRPQNVGQASAGTVTMTGSWLTFSGWNAQQIILKAGTDHLAVTYSKLSGGYFGVVAGDSTNTFATNMLILGNRFVGPFGEDGIRANRYRGLLIQGNEFTNIRENGNHSDCLQSVYGGETITFTRNYLHDNRCQGFFIKDQATNCNSWCTVNNVKVVDNLFVRNDKDCVPASLCAGNGGPAYFDVFGPISGFDMRRNTLYLPAATGGAVVFQDPGWSGIQLRDNYTTRLYGDPSLNYGGLQSTNNASCTAPNGNFGGVPGFTTGVCGGAIFQDPASDDFRDTTGSGRGVTWAPAGQRYGP